MTNQLHESQAIGQLVHSVLLQAGFMSDCGLDVCVAVVAPKCVQFWASTTWRTDIKDTMRRAANSQADLDEDNMTLDMFIERNSMSPNTTDRTTPDIPESDAAVLPLDETPADDEPSAFYITEDENIKSEREAVAVSGTRIKFTNKRCLEHDAAVLPHNETPADGETSASYIIEDENIKSEPDTASVGGARRKITNKRCLEQGPVESYLVRESNMDIGSSGSGSGEKTESAPDASELNQGRITLNQDRLTLNQDISRHSKPSITQLFDNQQPAATLTSETLQQAAFLGTSPGAAENHKYKCDKCGFSCIPIHDLLIHMRQHPKVNLYRCPQCSYGTSSKSNLNTHVQTHTGEQPYRCKFCDYRTDNSNSFRAHITTHTKASTCQNYKCKICDYKTGNLCMLRSHVAAHTRGAEKIYNCQSCTFKTSSAHSLQCHTRTKHPKDAMRCDFCDYTSKHEHRMRTHLKTHTVDTFKCDVCNYRTTNIGNLRVHRRTHTAEKPYQCTHCEYRATQSCNMIKHIRARHRLDNSNPL